MIGRLRRPLPSMFIGSADTTSPSASQSSLTPDAFSVIGNGTDDVALAVEALDENGLPVSGVATVITAEVVRASVATSAVIAAGQVAANTALTITVKIRDANSNPIPDVAAADIGLTSTGTGNTIGAFSGRTNEIGEITCTFQSSVEESKTLTGTIEGSNITATATVVVGSGGAPPGGTDPDYEMSSTAGDVRDTVAGVSWDTSDSDTSEQVVPAGRTGSGIRIRYAGTGAYYNAEQRFSLPANVTTFYAEYYLHAPTGYVKGSSNDKLFRLWGDTYGATNKVGFSTWYNTSYANNASVRVDRTTTSGIGPSAPSEGGATSPTATYGITLNGWVRVRMAYQMESATDANDQRIRIWFGDTLAIDWSDQNQIYDTARPYWNAGYLFGASNAGFPVQTDFYVHEVKFWWTNTPSWA